MEQLKYNSMDTLKIEIPKGFVIDTFDSKTGVVKFKKSPNEIKTLEDAINKLGEDDKEVINLFKLTREDFDNHILYRQQAVVIAKALNNGWVPDFLNSYQLKYEARFDFEASLGSFTCNDYDGWGTHSNVGSHLCFKSKELAEYFGKQFIDIHNKYFKHD